MNPHPFFLCPFSVPALSLFTPITSTHSLFSLPLAFIFAFLTSTHFMFPLPCARERGMHTPCCTFFFKKGLTFFSVKGRYTRETSDSIIAIMENCIKCELAGVVHSWTYSCFEALKVRDPRLEPVHHYSYYEDIRGNLEYIGPLGPPSLSMYKKRVNAVCVNPFC